MTEVLVDRPRPDTDDMLAVHQVFRDALSAAPTLVGTVAPGDTARAAVVGTYYANVLAFLHSHHCGEDETVWPLLAARAGQHAPEVERVAGQHHDVDAALARADVLLHAWSATPDAALATALATALTELHRLLVAHLDEEEQIVLPLAAQHLTIEEWAALPAHGMKVFSGDKLWLVMGLLRDRMTQEQRDAMLAHMPPPVVEFWQQVGEPSYREFLVELG